MLIPLLRTFRKYPGRVLASREFVRARAVGFVTGDLDCSSTRTISILPKKSLLLEETLCFKIKRRQLFSTTAGSLSPNEFGEVCEETLDSLAEYLEELVESVPAFKNGDVQHSDGVITAFLGSDFGTYVINRQTPNQQIWLSSPKSGPKRYDYIDGIWEYKHDNTTLHSLLDQEIGAIANCPVDFSSRCAFGKKGQ